MSFRLSWLLVGVTLLFGQVAIAQTVDTPNALVFYFDEESTQRSWYGTGEVTVYLTVGPMVHSEIPGNIPYNFLNSWSCAALSVYPLENVMNATLFVRGLGDELVPFPIESIGNDFSFDLLNPIPLDGRTVVAELRLIVLSTAPTALEAWGMEFTADGNPDFFWTLTHGSDGPMDMTGHTANINADSPVPVDQTSLGGLKALFR